MSSAPNRSPVSSRPAAPSRLIIAGLDDDRNRFDHYWSRLEAVDVPTPRTAFVPLESDATGHANWETEAVLGVMAEWDTERAFVRTQYKAAPLRLRAGSAIESRDADEIDRTVGSLLSQLRHTDFRHGGGLVVREWVDLGFCMHAAHDRCHPEVRFFVEDGEVLAASHDVERRSFVCASAYEHLRPLLDGIDGRTPRRYAEAVAAEFREDTWAVDFAMDTTGTWYCTELGLNAVRWNDREGDWWNHCGHGDAEPHSPREIHSAALHVGRRPRDD